MTKDEALREAIDTLKSTKHGNCDFAWIDETLKKCTEALAQPVQEPAAYDKTEMNSFVIDLYDKKMQEGKHGHYEIMFHVVHQAIKRFTLPLPEQRQPLTDEQVKELLLIGPVYAPDGLVTRTPFAYRKELLNTSLWAFRKAEAAHNIKENT